MEKSNARRTVARPLVRRRGGFKLADLCVVMAGLALLCVVVPAMRAHADESRNRILCAANLRSIATHAFIYSNQDIRNGGKFPRTYFDPGQPLDKTLLGNAAGRSRSFDVETPGIVGTNNVTSSFYLLLKSTDLTTDVFVCPSGGAQRAYVGQDLLNRSNWPAPYAAFNSYSYACPFPTAAAISSGWKFDNSLGRDYPLASDINPGMRNGVGPTTVAFNDDPTAMRPANSPNHWFDGMNVAYCDGSVEWQTSPFAGAQKVGQSFRDNIFTNNAGVGSNGRGGTIWGHPVDAADSVLLPTAQDSPTSEIAARTTDMSPTLAAVQQNWVAVAVAGVGALLVFGLVIWLVVRRKPPAAGQAYGAYPPGGYAPGAPPPPLPPQRR
jgi:prepilin-type processing-associated H-X9-DG protein